MIPCFIPTTILSPRSGHEDTSPAVPGTAVCEDAFPCVYPAGCACLAPPPCQHYPPVASGRLSSRRLGCSRRQHRVPVLRALFEHALAHRVQIVHFERLLRHKASARLSSCALPQLTHPEPRTCRL